MIVRMDVCFSCPKESFKYMFMSLVTLHARGAEFLSREEDGVVVVLGVPCVLLLLEKSPATHILQTLRWVSQFNQAHGLERERHTQGKKEKS